MQGGERGEEGGGKEEGGSVLLLPPYVEGVAEATPRVKVDVGSSGKVLRSVRHYTLMAAGGGVLHTSTGVSGGLKTGR